MSELSKKLRQPCHMLDCLMARNQAADELERIENAGEDATEYVLATINKELRVEIEHASERERTAFHAGFSEGSYWDSEGPPDVEEAWQTYRRETTKDKKLEHLPGCPHVENMARPESLRLIGPMCDCGKRRKELEEIRNTDWSSLLEKVTNSDEDQHGQT